MRHRIGRPRFMQSFSGGGSSTPFAIDGSTITITPGGGISSNNVQAAIMELDAEKVAKAGDTMSGLLTLSGAPSADLHASTKKYVDDSIAGAGGYTDEMAQDACATMIQNGTGITWSYNDASNTLTPTVTVTSGTSQSYVDTADGLRVLKAGDTMTGFLILHADPDAPLKAAPKQYVDSRPVGICFPFSGKPADSAYVIAPVSFPVTIPANLAGTVFMTNTVAAGSSLFTLNKLTSAGAVTTLGTITVTAGTRATVTLSGAGGSLAIGDAFVMVAPATQDATLADFGITVQAIRA